MKHGRMQAAWGAMDTLLTAGTLGSLSDGQLLDRFARDRGAAGQEAFRILVERHGAMVMAVCRGVVRDAHEAEDAFQATFLVLVRRADSIRRRETIAPWLHAVACRVARRARARTARRREREFAAEGDLAAPDQPSSGSPVTEQVLQEEIRRLPEVLRAPLILCCLEGLSYDVAARRLGVRQSTLRGRLHRARRRLEARLERRGLLAPLAARLANPGGLVPAPLSHSLIQSTHQVAARWATVGGLLAGADAIPEPISALARGVIQAMFLQTTRVCGIAMILTMGAVGTLVVAQQEKGGASRSPETPKAAAAAAAAQEPPAQPPPPVDLARKMQQIYDKLAQPIELNLPDSMTLEQFLKALKQATTSAEFPGLPIYVDPVGLHEAGASTLSVVHPYRVKGATLHDVLRWTLGPTRLAFFAGDGFVMISSRESIAERRLEALENKIDQLLDAMDRLEGRVRTLPRQRSGAGIR